ncbi:MAG: sigma-70 family polymerase sigma factor [Adhaeribacter sp.]|nr:sigma-70 family polymerase sigma factor [Adhaeribacter sp.]
MFREPLLPEFKHFMTEATTDSVLWELFKKGDRAAFSTIYQDHIQVLYSYGIKVCDDGEIVEDCIQELFIYLWHTKENLGPTTNIKYYLFKSLRRKIQAYIEADTKKNKISTAFANDRPATEDSPEYLLLAENHQKNNEEKMQQALLTLTNTQREAIYLRFYDNLGFQEIADIMGLQLKSTYNLISKAIEVLREQIQTIVLSLILSCALLY